MFTERKTRKQCFSIFFKFLHITVKQGNFDQQGYFDGS